MLIGQVAAGIGTTTRFQIEYCPGILHMITTAAPQQITVDVLGDGVICNIDGSGASAISRMLHVGRVTNQITIPLADGVVKKKTTTIAITNATAAAFDLYAFAQQPATRYWESVQQVALLNTGIRVERFFYAFFPAFVAADQFNIAYRNRFVEKMSPEDLRANVAFSEFVDGTASDLRVSNAMQLIDNITLYPAAQQNVYLVRQRAIGNLN